MKKLTSLFALIAVSFQLTAIAQPAHPTQKHELKTGPLSVIVDAGSGGKILSFRYGDTEILSQSKMPNSYGSTFWTSPQSEWNWPPVAEFDRNPYTIDEEGNGLSITSSESAKLKMRVSKQFQVDDTNHSLVVRYSIINSGNETRKVAPWEISRVPNDGLIFFDAPLESITPANLMNFTSKHGIVWYQPDATSENRKINADGKGWLAYLNNGILLVKQFEDLSAGQPAPGEAEIQVYVNRGKTYIELESQGAYTTLAPGEELSWTVRWFAIPYSGKAPSKQVVKKIRKNLVFQ